MWSSDCFSASSCVSSAFQGPGFQGPVQGFESRVRIQVLEVPLGNLCIPIIHSLADDVIHFENNLNFLIKSFSYI